MKQLFLKKYLLYVVTIYLAQRSIPSLSSSLRTRFRFGRIAGESLSWSSFTVCRSGLETFRLTFIFVVVEYKQWQIIVK